MLPIGGLKEKLLAAHRAGIFEAILPGENRKDLADLPDLIKNSMKLNFVDNMDQVLEIALAAKLPRLEEETPEALGSMPPPSSEAPAAAATNRKPGRPRKLKSPPKPKRRRASSHQPRA